MHIEKMCSRLWAIDEDRHVAAGGRVVDHLEDAGRLLDAERGGRLVEEQQAPAPERGLADRDDLALAAGHRVDRRVEVGEARRQLGDRLTRRHRHLALAQEAERLEQAAPDELAPEEQVVGQVEHLDEGEVLVDGLDAGRERLGRASRTRASSPRDGSRHRSGVRTPAMHLTRVDLPAPLSPTRPTTSPRRNSKLTSFSASTAP